MTPKYLGLKTMMTVDFAHKSDFWGDLMGTAP